MSNTVYPLCARCCLKFRLLRPHNAQRWGMALSSTRSVLITRPLSSDTDTEHAYMHRQAFKHANAGIYTQKHSYVYDKPSMYIHTHTLKHTQKSFLSTEKPSVPQKSLSNSYSSAVLSLSGSEASLGIDCQAYCVYHLSAISQRENTSMLGETHALRFPFNLTGIEVER